MYSLLYCTMREILYITFKPPVILRVPDLGKAEDQWTEGQTKNVIIPKHATKWKHVQIFTKAIKLYTYTSKAQFEPTAVIVRPKARRLQPFKHWDRGFEPHFRHERMPASLPCFCFVYVYFLHWANPPSKNYQLSIRSTIS
jgi:hypothetical protein